MSDDQQSVNRSRAAWRKLYEDERFAHFKTRAEIRELLREAGAATAFMPETWKLRVKEIADAR